MRGEELRGEELRGEGLGARALCKANMQLDFSYA